MQVVRNTQKIVLKELTTATSSGKQLHSAVNRLPACASPADHRAYQQADKQVLQLIALVTGLRRRVEDMEKQAMKHAKVLGVRLDYLSSMEAEEERERSRGGGSSRGLAAAAGAAVPPTAAAAAAGRKGTVAGATEDKREKGGGDTKAAEEEGMADVGNGHAAAAAAGNGHNGHAASHHRSPAAASPAPPTPSPSSFSLSSIKSLTPSPSPSIRIHRLLLDYLLRAAYYRTAAMLAAASSGSPASPAVSSASSSLLTASPSGSASLSPLSLLSDTELFASLKRVVVSLRAHETSRALQWCGEQRSRLRAVGSSLEFELRLQEMMELVKKGERTAALDYARQHLGPAVLAGREAGGKGGAGEGEDDKENGAADGAAGGSEKSQWEDAVVQERMRKLQEAMAALTFFSLYQHSAASASSSLPASLLPGKSIAYTRYSQYWSKARWEQLEHQFRLTHLAVHGLPQHSLLALTLYTGLAALKTPYCQCRPASASSSSLSPSALKSASSSSAFSPASGCPLCSSRALYELSSGLPSTQRSQSCLVCRLSGCVMDEHNPPCVLPNGSLYSKKALQRMAAENRGQVVCIRTQQTFNIDECKLAYVL